MYYIIITMQIIILGKESFKTPSLRILKLKQAGTVMLDTGTLMPGQGRAGNIMLQAAPTTPSTDFNSKLH